MSKSLHGTEQNPEQSKTRNRAKPGSINNSTVDTDRGCRVSNWTFYQVIYKIAHYTGNPNMKVTCDASNIEIV